MTSDTERWREQELFVNRERAREEFLQIVATRPTSRFLEFTAIAGQGKTELLQWIYRNPDRAAYVAAYIDLERAPYHHAEIYPILDTIAGHLTQQTAAPIFQNFQQPFMEYVAGLRAIYATNWQNFATEKPPRLQESETHLVQTFQEDLTMLLQTQIVVVCLDSTEKAYAPAFAAFEERILLPLAHVRNFLLIVAGQKPIAWRHHVLRDHLKTQPLPPFTPQWGYQQLDRLAQIKQIPIQDREIVADKMMQVTLGHPFSNYRLLAFWTQDFTRPLDKTVVETHFAAGIQHLCEKVVARRILERAHFGALYPPTHQMLLYLAPLRQIELSMFRFVLTTYLGAWFADKPITFFERLLGHFQATAIFTRWQLGSGFDLDPVARNILLWEMRVKTPDLYLEMADRLEKQYDLKVAKTHEATQIKNMLERVYHYATYVKATQPNYVNALAQNEVQRYVTTYLTLTACDDDEVALREQFLRLLRAFEADAELATLIDVNAILELIREAAPAAAAM